MIRGTINEGISSLSKQRHVALGLINNGVGGESFETVADSVGGGVVERRDGIDDHEIALSVFPSNAFNGTFE